LVSGNQPGLSGFTLFAGLSIKINFSLLILTAGTQNQIILSSVAMSRKVNGLRRIA